MINRRRGERVKLDESAELLVLEPEFESKGPFRIVEMSYELGRKYGVHLNLMPTGLRFAGNIDLEAGRRITIRLKEQHEPLEGIVSWKKKIDDTEFMYGLKVNIFMDRRSRDRVDLDEALEMIVLQPDLPEIGEYKVEEVSYGLVRKQGVHLSRHITGLRFGSNIDFETGQDIVFQIPLEEEQLRGTIVWKEASDEKRSYGVQISYLG